MTKIETRVIVTVWMVSPQSGLETWLFTRSYPPNEDFNVISTSIFSQWSNTIQCVYSRDKHLAHGVVSRTEWWLVVQPDDGEEDNNGSHSTGRRKW